MPTLSYIFYTLSTYVTGMYLHSVPVYLCEISPDHCTSCFDEECPPTLETPLIFCCDPDSPQTPCLVRKTVEDCPVWTVNGACYNVVRENAVRAYCKFPDENNP